MSAVHPGYAPPTGSARPPGRRRAARWLLVATVAWAVLLAALTWWSVRTDPPTVKEQRTIGQAAPVVERAVGRLVAAIGPAAAWVMTPDSVEKGCRVTPVSSGADLTRGVDVLLAEGGERPLLDRVADALPEPWRAGVRDSVDGPRLRADAGDFVLVEGEVAGPGRVRFTVATGCRPADVEFVDSLPLPAAGPALDEASRALGRPATDATRAVVARCPDGGKAWTRWMDAGSEPVSLAALAPLAAGAVLVDTPEAYAYRRGPDIVVADATGEELRLAASTGCAG
ncbi:hypothetical protein GKC29_07100 [Micromonospora sp. WMMC415]|uniref:hypothetical protein n=1 Tax=Micromonospora sp. WMMC415 TaxID=2675222 RepID=UPI0012B4B098|nr:hypothetical protein [Micromonospora sp. WMMC415]QGN46629.1 hypothetical protein GKC29_07100 [Micromonospora sp. WMMC415]